MKHFWHTLIIILAVSCIGCDEKSVTTVDKTEPTPEPHKIDYSLISPETKDGDFFRTLRRKPIRKVFIDLRKPLDLSGIPEVEWSTMGDRASCAIEGTTDTTLILPSGTIIQEEFAIVYIDKSPQGIVEVRADSLGWLKTVTAKKRLDREISFFVEEGADLGLMQTQRHTVIDWLDNYDHNSGMRSGLSYRCSDVLLGFQLVTTDANYGIRYRYTAMLPGLNSHSRRYNKAWIEQAAEQDAPDHFPAGEPDE